MGFESCNFIIAPAVAGFVDELGGGGEVFAGFVWLALGEAEAGGFEVVVGQVELHFAAFGYFARFVQVALGEFVVAGYPMQFRPRQQAARNVVSCTCLPQALDRKSVV